MCPPAMYEPNNIYASSYMPARELPSVSISMCNLLLERRRFPAQPQSTHNCQSTKRLTTGIIAWCSLLPDHSSSYTCIIAFNSNPHVSDLNDCWISIALGSSLYSLHSHKASTLCSFLPGVAPGLIKSTSIMRMLDMSSENTSSHGSENLGISQLV